MSAIETYLQYIASKVWARDVRTAIVNAIRQCYDDVHNPTLNTEALQAAIQAKIDAGQMAALTIGDRTITAAKLALGVIPTPDATLSQSGVPADAKKTGDEITAINESIGDVQADLDAKGLSNDAKVALLNCFSHIAYIDAQGQSYYNALESALYPDTGLVRISAVFTQGNAVIYQTTPLNDLKAYLVVTGHYNNGTSNVITDYSLSGTLAVGTSTVTVNANGKTTTFNVTVSAPYWDYEWSASSRVAPAQLHAYDYDFTTYNDAMFVDNWYVDFDYVGDCEILFVAKLSEQAVTSNQRTPQISIRSAANGNNYNGFKVCWQTPSGVVETNLSGTFVANSQNIGYNDYHEYRAKFENGVGYLYIDGTLVEQGSGVTNNQYIFMTGLFGAIMTNNEFDTTITIPGHKSAIKEIKFKRLT